MVSKDREGIAIDPGKADAERRLVGKVSRYFFPYFIVGMMFVQLDKTSIGFAQLTMGQDLGLTATAFGFAAGIFSLAAFFSQVPAGLFFERFGARRWLTGIMIAWGCVCMAQAFVTSFNQLVVLRFLLGAFEAGFLPGVFVLISIWFRSEKHGRAVSCAQIGTATAGIIGGPFAGWILGESLFGLAGWRGLFLIYGAATLLCAIVGWFFVTDDPRTARWLKPAERDLMAGHLDAYQAEKASKGALQKTRVRDALRDPRVLLLTFSYACAGWAAGTFTFFTPTLLKTAGKGLDLWTVGLLSVVPYVVNVIVAATWGAHADRTRERHWHTVGPIFLAIAGVLLYPLATTAAVALLALVLVHAGNTGLYVNFWATCTMIAGKGTVAKSTAIINSGSAAATFVGPIVFGRAMDLTGSSTVGLYICGGVMLLNFAILNVFFLRYKSQLRFQPS